MWGVALELHEHAVVPVHEADPVHVGTVVVPHLGQLQPGRELVVHAGNQAVSLADVSEEVEGAPSEACHNGIALATAACVRALQSVCITHRQDCIIGT